MDKQEKNLIFSRIVWDYNLPALEIEAVLNGEKEMVGHYNREMLFLKMIESYSWFTITQIFTPAEIQSLLTKNVISKLRSPSLRKKYEYVQQRLREIIPVAG